VRHVLKSVSMNVRALTGADAAAIAAWRYPGRYATYDCDDAASLEHDHWAVSDERGELVGYCVFGAAARVAGAAAEAGTLDIGYGMKPELMGGGNGRRFVGAILEFALGQDDPRRLRLFVLDWNERSRRVAAAHGFGVERAVEGDGERFLVMVREARGAIASRS
jgi:[ribosomal protein S18]-alanine N-acetyltransferase